MSCVEGAFEVLKTHLRYELPRKYVSAAFRMGSRPDNQARDNRKIILKLDEGHFKRDLSVPIKRWKLGVFI